MSKQLIFGHQNPDTDAIVAAMAFSYLENKLGKETEAVALGEPNDETKFVLDHFNAKAPRVITSAAAEVSQVMLVDHNEAQQSVADIKDVQVVAVVDHHRIANFETANPLFYRAEPVGCTSTILTKLYHENDVVIPKQLAGLMLSAIISDTLLLKSPTTTDDDHQAVKELAKLAGVDENQYGLEMLRAGTNVDDKSASELIAADAKSFTMAGKSVRVAQINTVDVNDIYKRQADFEAAITAANKAEGYDLFVLMVTNILDSDSDVLVVGGPTAPVEQAFSAKLANKRIALPGVVSRKKQIVPQLTDAFNA
ncbi:manganese-dependent inorganic pyrophosphatase [Loigolactobacillus backii]|uniref:manganese-dependent inorganic pyrophosphatase n=1 Tax=Loigolactobacillus backii TaxID=375175 RepID=UPI000C1CA77E|nr:manganese-dependent inorganic pyrophosphatase [Loigolactobacillus backii]PIO83404.1 manganese-dependent inorganic pyrophosphatase [Loigolactobacillus backii]